MEAVIVARRSGIVSSSSRGARGYSAYEIAVQHGYEGTEEEWLDYISEHAADDAREQADRAQGYAEEARESADIAVSSANTAVTKAEQATESERIATEAAQTAVEKAQQASESQGIATESANSASMSAIRASQSAASAKQSAEDADLSADRAEQAAATAGYLDVDIVNGRLIYTKTDAVDVDFDIDENGHLIAEVV